MRFIADINARNIMKRAFLYVKLNEVFVSTGA